MADKRQRAVTEREIGTRKNAAAHKSGAEHDVPLGWPMWPPRGDAEKMQDRAAA